MIQTRDGLPVELIPGTHRARLVRTDQEQGRGARRLGEQTHVSEVLGAASPYRNKTERLYAQYLDTLRFAGEIQSFRYEPMRLLLAKRTTYQPDFLIVTTLGQIELHEVKGYMRDDAAVKIKVAAQAFPMFTFRLIRRKAGQWVEQPVLG